MSVPVTRSWLNNKKARTSANHFQERFAGVMREKFGKGTPSEDTVTHAARLKKSVMGINSLQVNTE